MPESPDANFAGGLVSRLGPQSHLLDAATGEQIPGDELPHRIRSFAQGFLAAGLAPGERVLVACSLHPASTMAYLGAMYAGLVPVLVEERLLARGAGPLCAHAQAKGIWIDATTQCESAKGLGGLCWQGDFAPRAAGYFAPAPRWPDDLAVLMPTSGSTGISRLVMVSHGNLLANTEAIIRSQQLGHDERAMLILPVSYCFGASVLHTHLWQGGSVIFDSRFMFPDKVLRAMQTYACTTFAGVPTVYNVLLTRSNLRSIPLPALRRCLQAGGALAPASIQAMRQALPAVAFYVMYGQTEATARITCLPPERLEQKLGSAGPALDNLVLRIVGEPGGEVPPGQTGEVWVKGPSVCAGYFNDPQQTALKFQNGWLMTGDVASLDADGYLWITGRKDEFMKIRGLRVSFAEIEACVANNAGVNECAVTSMPHPEAGEVPVIFVVAEHHAHDVAARVRKSLPPEWTCERVAVVPELPKTTNGKIARNLLRTMASDL